MSNIKILLSENILNNGAIICLADTGTNIHSLTGEVNSVESVNEEIKKSITTGTTHLQKKGVIQPDLVERESLKYQPTFNFVIVNSNTSKPWNTSTGKIIKTKKHDNGYSPYIAQCNGLMMKIPQSLIEKNADFNLALYQLIYTSFNINVYNKSTDLAFKKLVFFKK